MLVGMWLLILRSINNASQSNDDNTSRDILDECDWFIKQLITDPTFHRLLSAVASCLTPNSLINQPTNQVVGGVDG